jgi:hypothetical protein
LAVALPPALFGSPEQLNIAPAHAKLEKDPTTNMVDTMRAMGFSRYRSAPLAPTAWPALDDFPRVRVNSETATHAPSASFQIDR